MDSGPVTDSGLVREFATEYSKLLRLSTQLLDTGILMTMVSIPDVRSVESFQSAPCPPWHRRPADGDSSAPLTEVPSHQTVPALVAEGGSVPALRTGSGQEKPRAFVISLCCGIGASYDAVELFTDRIDGHACELLGNLRDLMDRRWPGIRKSKDVSKLDMQEVEAHIAAHKPELVILLCQPPAQRSGLASLPKAYGEERTVPIQQFLRIRVAIREYCEINGVNFKWLLEETATMSQAHRQEISQAVGESPLLIHASDFGWIHRSRLFWGPPVTDVVKSKHPSMKHIEVVYADGAPDVVCIVRWSGPPVPAQWAPDDG